VISSGQCASNKRQVNDGKSMICMEMVVNGGGWWFFSAWQPNDSKRVLKGLYCSKRDEAALECKGRRSALLCWAVHLHDTLVSTVVFWCLLFANAYAAVLDHAEGSGWVIVQPPLLQRMRRQIG
jgi:hypothetical protein